MTVLVHEISNCCAQRLNLEACACAASVVENREGVRQEKCQQGACGAAQSDAEASVGRLLTRDTGLERGGPSVLLEWIAINARGLFILKGKVGAPGLRVANERRDTAYGQTEGYALDTE